MKKLLFALILIATVSIAWANVELVSLEGSLYIDCAPGGPERVDYVADGIRTNTQNGYAMNLHGEGVGEISDDIYLVSIQLNSEFTPGRAVHIQQHYLITNDSVTYSLSGHITIANGTKEQTSGPEFCHAN